MKPVIKMRVVRVSESYTTNVNSKINDLKKITEFKDEREQKGGGNEIHEDIQF